MVVFVLLCKSQLLAAGYLRKMLENVTSNHYFETPCGFRGFILPEVLERLVLKIVLPPLTLIANQNLLQKLSRSFSYAINLHETGCIVLGVFFCRDL